MTKEERDIQILYSDYSKRWYKTLELKIYDFDFSIDFAYDIEDIEYKLEDKTYDILIYHLRNINRNEEIREGLKEILKNNRNLQLILVSNQLHNWESKSLLKGLSYTGVNGGDFLIDRFENYIEKLGFEIKE